MLGNRAARDAVPEHYSTSYGGKIQGIQNFVLMLYKYHTHITNILHIPITSY